MNPEKQSIQEKEHLLELAWGLISNASGGNWLNENKAWQEAAHKWRDDYFATLPHAPEPKEIE